MKSKSCVVVDYGIGNVFSVMHALQSCGAEAELTNNRDKIISADRIILPGVGAFGQAATRLRELELDQAVLEFVQTGKPFLGICVGMQLLMTTGYEFGNHAGLNVIGGTVEKIDLTAENGSKVRVPLIGWYPLQTLSGPESETGSPLDGQSPEAAFYFVHSYAVQPTDSGNVLATVRQGVENVVAVVRRDNVFGVQFHPERSSGSGLKFLNTFLGL